MGRDFGGLGRGWVSCVWRRDINPNDPGLLVFPLVCGCLPHCARVGLYGQYNTAEVMVCHFWDQLIKDYIFCLRFTLCLLDYLPWGKPAAMLWGCLDSLYAGPHGEELRPPAKASEAPRPANSHVCEFGIESRSPRWLWPWLRAWLQPHDRLRINHPAKLLPDSWFSEIVWPNKCLGFFFYVDHF